MAEQQQLFFAREREFIKVFTLDTSSDQPKIDKEEARFSLPTPKVSFWSPNGAALALADPTKGVLVVELADTPEDTALHTLSGSAKTVGGLLWSPCSSTLVTISTLAKGSAEPNVHAWRKNEAGEYSCAAGFAHPKLDVRDRKVFQWSKDGRFCAHLCADGVVHVLSGNDLAGKPLAELKLAHQVESVMFAPPSADQPEGRARLAVFVPDVRDDLQRVVGPAEVSIWELVQEGEGDVQCKPIHAAPVESGQQAEFHWSPTGTALIAHCQTEVDESGQSYYGGSKLLLISNDGDFVKDLTASDEGAPNGNSIQAVEWSPTHDEFILIRGFQPAQTALWTWDSQAKSAKLVKILLEKAHRNTIRFNHFGSLVCLAGFGNLAGGVDFFGRLEGTSDYVPVSNCTANCTVMSEWAPDGRNFMTAVLAPRMRVDNGLGVWRALAGTQVSNVSFEELYDTQWRPEPNGSSRFSAVTREEIETAAKELVKRKADGAGADKPKQAYRPPKARGESGGSSVAAMMRGEMANDGPDARHLRKPRVPVRAEESPNIGPASDPPPPQEAPAAAAQPRKANPFGAAAKDPSFAPEPRQAAPAPAQPRKANPFGAASQQPPQTNLTQQRPAPEPQHHHSKAANARVDTQQAMFATQMRSPEQQAERQEQVAQAAALNQQRIDQQRAAAAEHQSAAPAPGGKDRPPDQQQVRKSAHSHGEKLPCPATGWQYMDPRKNIQGPFTLLEMQQWNSMGYFRPDLAMRCDPSDRFVPFNDLFPHPLIPFQSYPKRPRGMGGF